VKQFFQLKSETNEMNSVQFQGDNDSDESTIVKENDDDSYTKMKDLQSIDYGKIEQGNNSSDEESIFPT
jgi:hypothetical protein